MPIKDQESKTIAKKLINNIICRYGILEIIHTDQGKNFESEIIKNICSFLGIYKTRTFAYNPKSNGMVERLNQTIVNALYKITKNKED